MPAALLELIPGEAVFLILFVGAAGVAFLRQQMVFKKRARQDIKIIRRAMAAYVDNYGMIPAVHVFGDEQPVELLLDVLSGIDLRPAQELTHGFLKLNPEKKNFLSELGSRREPYSSLLDPWGNPYRIAIDTDYDGVTEIAIEDTQTAHLGGTIKSITRSERASRVRVYAPCAVWSCGPNGKNECGYGDDICSWMP